MRQFISSQPQRSPSYFRSYAVPNLLQIRDSMASSTSPHSQVGSRPHQASLGIPANGYSLRAPKAARPPAIERTHARPPQNTLAARRLDIPPASSAPGGLHQVREPRPNRAES